MAIAGGMLAAFSTAGALLRGAWRLLRAVPLEAWAVIALLAVAWRYGEHRFNSGEAAATTRCEAAQVRTERDSQQAQLTRDSAAETVNTTTDWTAREAVVQSRTETATAVERVRHVTRTIEVAADCPAGLPDRVHAEGRAAVQRARAAGDPLRADGHARSP